MSWLALAAGAVLSVQPIDGDPTRVVVTAEGAPAKSVLSFSHRKRREADGTSAIASVSAGLFGETEKRGDRIRFRPSFALSEGETYIARLTFLSGESVDKEYRVPEGAGTVPKVLLISPGGNVLPANLLKFYLHFDQPMREGRDIFDQIELIDENGKAVNSPWRRQEVWSDDAKRLILFIHPGRIKQGLQLRAEMGPVLEEGRTYSLVVSDKVRSANGVPLGGKNTITFETGTAIRKRIDPGEWMLVPPAAGSHEAFVFRSERALDPYLVQRHCEIGGEPFERVDWNEEQTEFRFFPAKPWVAGEYELTIGEYLEDLAGNTPARVFDTDLESVVGENPKLSLSFTVAP